jgi:hypothetical protein
MPHGTATPRRRVLRTAPATSPVDFRQQARLAKRRERLAKERNVLDRWMGRLRRAFHAVEKQQQRVARLERQLDGPAPPGN